MLNLDAIVFSAITTDLERADKVIAQLGATAETMANKVNKSQSKTNSALKDSATGTEALAQAETKAIDAKSKSVSMLDKQLTSMKILRGETITLGDSVINMGAGFTKSQAGQLAFMALSGKTADELTKMANSFKDFATISGSNPFDRSSSGITKMVRELNELKDVEKLARMEQSLTRDEVINLMRDKQRLLQMNISEGKSLSELKTSLRSLKEEYMNVGTALNIARANAKEQEVQAKKAANSAIQAAKDQAKANQTVEDSISKLDNRLKGFAIDLDTASSDAFVKFQNALGKSKRPMEEQVVLLEQYRTKLAQVQDQENQARSRNLTRSLQPQISDVAISLWSGQQPLTVLLQQGSQVVDLVNLSGVAAKDLNGVMKKAMSDMVANIRLTAAAMGSLFVGAVTDAGTAVMKYFGQASANAFMPIALGARTMAESLKYATISALQGKEAAEAYAASLITVRNQQSFLSEGAIKLGGAITGINLLALAAGVVALGVAFVQAIKEENNLAKSLALTGASLGLNAAGAVAYAQGLKGIGGTTGEVISVINEMAKAGGFANSQIAMISETAIALERSVGVPVAETVKRFEELGKSPVESLIKLARETGNVSIATVQQVIELTRLGRQQEAATLAQDAFRTSSLKLKDDVEKQWGFLTTLANKVKNAWTELNDEIQNRVRNNGSDQLKRELEDLNKELAQMKTVPSWLRSDSAYKAVNDRIQEINNTFLEQNKLLNKGAQLRDEQLRGLDTVSKVEKEANAIIKAEKMKTLSKKEYIEAALKERFGPDLKFAKETQNATAYASAVKAAGIEWEKLNKNKSSGSNTPVKQEVDTIGLLRSQYQSQQQVIESALQLQLDTYSRYRKYGLSLTAETADEESKAIEAGLKTSLEALQNYGKQAGAALEKERANTKAAYAANKQSASNTTARENALTAITRKESELNNYLTAQRALLSDRSISRYLDDMTSGGKALVDFTKSLKDANTEEEKLRNMRAANQSTAMSNLFATPEQAAYLKGYNEELRRVEEIQSRLQSQLAATSEEVTKAGVAFSRARLSPNTSSADAEMLGKLWDAAKAKLAQLTSGYQSFKDGIKGNAELQGKAEKFKYFQDSLTGFISATESTGFLDKLNSGFTSAGDAIGTMITAMDELSKSQENFNKVQGKMRAYGMHKEAAELEAKYAKSREVYTIKQIGTVKKYFGEQTAGYKILDKVEKGYRVKQLAETIKEYAVRKGLVQEETFAKIAGWVAGANASIGAAATSIASMMGMGSVAAALAPVMAAAGTPGPAAFAAFAAMAALMASTIFGGSSGGVSSWNNTGTGTVLGDTSAKSESLKNALSKLEDVSSKTMTYSSGMLASLKVIESNTAGLANLLVRSGAASAGEFGIQEGTQATTASKLLGLNYGSFLPIVGGLISKVATSLFGKKTTINSQGLMAQTGTLGSIFGAGLTGGTLGLSNYADVTTKKKAFGITYSSNSSTQTTAASAETADQFSKIILGFVDSIKLAGNGLGVGTDNILNSLEGFNLDLGKIDLKGLTGTEIQAKLEAVFGALGDKMAQAAFGGLVDFQKVGEGYFETLVRVSSAVEESSLILKKLGVASIGYTDVLNKQGDVAAEIVRQSLGAVTSLTGVASVLSQMTGTADEIASAFGVMADAVSTLKFIGNSSADVTYNLLASVGGFDSLSSAMSAFRENYLTDAQQIQYTSQELSKQFAALGLAMPTTGAGFVSLVQGIDATTSAGQSLLGSVLGLSDAFSTVAAEYTRVQEERLGLESQILNLQGKTSELRAIELAKLDPTNRALQEQIYLLQDQAKATEELTSALSAAGTAITTEINRLRNAATGTSTDSLATLQAKFAVSTAAARSGDLTALAGLTDLSQSVETAAINSASSSMQVQQMRAWLASSLETTAAGLGLDLSGLTTGTSATSSTNVVTATSSGLSTTSTSSLIDITSLLTELQSLRTEVQGLRTEVVAGVQYEAKISKILDRVTQDGENVSVKVTP